MRHIQEKPFLGGLAALGGFLFLSAVFLSAVMGLAFLAGTAPAAVSAGTEPLPEPLVILDPGHGGEDGGAVGVSGKKEKDLNLAVSLRIYEILEGAGIPCVLTRNADYGLYDGAKPGQRKMTDLCNRLAFTERYPEAVFLSIHMNTFSDGKYHGLQVFYSQNDPKSRDLAESVKERTREVLDPENQRECKPAGENIYILDRAKSCAVLAECGFLSNAEEEAMLCSPEYREKLAAAIASAVLSYLHENNETGSVT